MCCIASQPMRATQSGRPPTGLTVILDTHPAPRLSAARLCDVGQTRRCPGQERSWKVQLELEVEVSIFPKMSLWRRLSMEGWCMLADLSETPRINGWIARCDDPARTQRPRNCWNPANARRSMTRSGSGCLFVVGFTAASRLQGVCYFRGMDEK